MAETKPEPGETKPAPDATFTPDHETPEPLESVLDRPEVKAILPLRDQPLPSDRQAAAVHDDEVWDGPRLIHNAESEPVYVRTKAEYWELLRRNGLRMRDQQESRTGVEGPPRPVLVPTHETPHPPVALMTQHEAEVFGAVTAVFQRYGLVESIWCLACFERNRPHGCKLVVNRRGVAFRCSGGLTAWNTPVGERNVLLQTLANTTSSRTLDRAPGTVLTPAGPVFRPARLLLPEEVLICREYFTVLRKRGLEPRWHHLGCWSGNAWHEHDAMAIYVDDDSLIAVCQCMQLYAHRSRPTPTLVH